MYKSLVRRVIVCYSFLWHLSLVLDTRKHILGFRLNISWTKNEEIRYEEVAVRLVTEPTPTCDDFKEKNHWMTCASFKKAKQCNSNTACGLGTGGSTSYNLRYQFFLVFDVLLPWLKTNKVSVTVFKQFYKVMQPKYTRLIWYVTNQHTRYVFNFIGFGTTRKIKTCIVKMQNN